MTKEGMIKLAKARLEQKSQERHFSDETVLRMKKGYEIKCERYKSEIKKLKNENNKQYESKIKKLENENDELKGLIIILYIVIVFMWICMF